MTINQAGIPWLARMAKPKPPQILPEIRWIQYDIPLARLDSNCRRAFARFVLPMDLTESEAQRIAGIVGGLAFPDA